MMGILAILLGYPERQQPDLTHAWGRARQGSKSPRTGQGSRGPNRVRACAVLRLAAKAQVETLLFPGGLNHIEVRAAGGVGLARGPGGALRPLLAPDAEEATELGKRVGVIVDPNVEVGKVLGGGQQECCRLAAATVAARTLSGLNGVDQALGQGKIAPSRKALDGGCQHGRAGQHVAGDGKLVLGTLSAPFHAVPAGP